MTEHYEEALKKGADWLTSLPEGASLKHRRDTLQAVFAAAYPELRKHFTQDPEVRRAIIKALADEAEKEWTDGIVGNIVPRMPFEAEEWLRARIKTPDFPEFAQRRSMDVSLTSERVKSSEDEPLPAESLPVDELNKKLGW